MIKVSGSVRLNFLFPADRVTTYTYYSDMYRLVRHLHGIDLIQDFSNLEYRLYYHTVELNSYHIRALCDVRMVLNDDECTIRIVPIENEPDVETEVTLNSTKARGYYSSEAFFYEVGPQQTRVEYLLRMEASPPRPLGMRFMPRRIVDKIAKNITTHRIQEIANHFIKSSIDKFPDWAAENGLFIEEIGD